jgi:hypothetical protein
LCLAADDRVQFPVRIDALALVDAPTPAQLLGKPATPEELDATGMELPDAERRTAAGAMVVMVFDAEHVSLQMKAAAQFIAVERPGDGWEFVKSRYGATGYAGGKTAIAGMTARLANHVWVGAERRDGA